MRWDVLSSGPPVAPFPRDPKLDSLLLSFLIHPNMKAAIPVDAVMANTDCVTLTLWRSQTSVCK